MQPWVAAAVSAMILTACCPAAAPLRPVVEIPTLPPLPTVKAEEFRQVVPNDPNSDLLIRPDVYVRLVDRELIIKGTLAECQAILETIVEE